MSDVTTTQYPVLPASVNMDAKQLISCLLCWAAVPLSIRLISGGSVPVIKAACNTGGRITLSGVPLAMTSLRAEQGNTVCTTSRNGNDVIISDCSKDVEILFMYTDGDAGAPFSTINRMGIKCSEIDAAGVSHVVTADYAGRCSEQPTLMESFDNYYLYAANHYRYWTTIHTFQFHGYKYLQIRCDIHICPCSGVGPSSRRRRRRNMPFGKEDRYLQTHDVIEIVGVTSSAPAF
ncbi:hypothetical protein MAR_030957, partial [Mya arenaria]